MNGQNRIQGPPPSGFTGPDIRGNNVTVTGPVKNNSWAQVGLVNPRQDLTNATAQHTLPHLDPSLRPAATTSAQQPRPFAAEFTYPNPLLHSLYSIPSLGSLVANGSEAVRSLPASIESSIMDKGRLLVPGVTASNTSSASVGSLQSLKSQAKLVTSAPDGEIPSKRMKVAGPSEWMSSPQPANVTQYAQKLPVPHKPEYFHRGSVIQLSEHKLKRIEDLQTSDFEYSAKISSDLSLDSSTVVKITEDVSRGTAFLTFSVGDHKHKPLEATVEATMEHPFFVFGQGWSSVKPESTLSYYKMKCQQLRVHDRCISLTFKDPESINNSAYGNYHSAQSALPPPVVQNTENPQSK